MNIITSICVDESPEQSDAQYLTMPRTTGTIRRNTYWLCATVFFASSIRFNPGAHHILFTNDTEDVFIKGINVRTLLRQMGVEVRVLPFREFVPPAELHTTYRNCFYRADIMYALPDDIECSMMIDSDCIWSRSVENLEQTISSGELFLIDTYHMADPEAKVLGFSRKDLGALFRAIDPNYPESTPIWFGGEFLAGQNRAINLIGGELKELFDEIIHDHTKVNARLPNGQRILDCDEYLTSMIVNKHLRQWKDATPLIRRIWTVNNAVTANEVMTPIWHLPVEKRISFPFLFDVVSDLHSVFWKMPLEQIPGYLGRIVGVPRRTQFSWEAVKLEFRSRSKDMIRRATQLFGSSFNPEQFS